MRGKWKFIELQRSVMRSAWSGVDTFKEVDPSKDSNRHFQECDLCKVVPCLRDLGLPFIWVKVWVGNNEETGTKIWDLCAENYFDRNLIILVRIWVGKKKILAWNYFIVFFGTFSYSLIIQSNRFAYVCIRMHSFSTKRSKRASKEVSTNTLTATLYF